MDLSRDVQSMGWTRRDAVESIRAVMEEHRKAAGQRLAKIRDAAGLGQEDLAGKAGLAVKTISRFENGRAARAAAAKRNRKEG
jgi:DNA-binding XRE family transcriptional regulator